MCSASWRDWHTPLQLLTSCPKAEASPSKMAPPNQSVFNTIEHSVLTKSLCRVQSVLNLPLQPQDKETSHSHVPQRADVGPFPAVLCSEACNCSSLPHTLFESYLCFTFLFYFHLFMLSTWLPKMTVLSCWHCTRRSQGRGRLNTFVSGQRT